MSRKGREVNTASHSSTRPFFTELTFAAMAGPDNTGHRWHLISHSNSSHPLRPKASLHSEAFPKSQIRMDSALRFISIYPLEAHNHIKALVQSHIYMSLSYNGDITGIE